MIFDEAAVEQHLAAIANRLQADRHAATNCRPAHHPTHRRGCPGSRTIAFNRPEGYAPVKIPAVSSWPSAGSTAFGFDHRPLTFQGADLLITADCVGWPMQVTRRLPQGKAW